jgi:hypothetical protein
MPLQERPRPYPLIDADPHAGRVVRYMRSSDYAVWGGATVAGPALLYLYGESEWNGVSGRKPYRDHEDGGIGGVGGIGGAAESGCWM